MTFKDHTIDIDKLTDGQVIALLEQHRIEMLRHSPPESSHALNSQALRHPDLTVWSARDIDDKVLGCVALKVFPKSRDADVSTSPYAEIKSMKVDPSATRRGIGRALLMHILGHAAKHQIAYLALETGTNKVFNPARRLYTAHGFKECDPFGSYQKDPHSVFYQLSLD